MAQDDQLIAILQKLADQSAWMVPSLSYSLPEKRRELVLQAAQKITELYKAKD